MKIGDTAIYIGRATTTIRRGVVVAVDTETVTIRDGNVGLSAPAEDFKLESEAK